MNPIFKRDLIKNATDEGNAFGLHIFKEGVDKPRTERKPNIVDAITNKDFLFSLTIIFHLNKSVILSL